MTRLVFTCGDINGIGPEIVIKALNKISSRYKNSKYCFIIPENVFNRVTLLVKPEFKYELKAPDDFKETKTDVTVLLQPPVKMKIGIATKDSGKAAYDSLKASFILLKHGLADAVVTAPVSKTAFRLSGINFPGQTELFAHWSKSKNFTMMFLSKRLKVSLYSIHVPIKKVPGLIRHKKFLMKLNLLQKTLQTDFSIKDPRIAVLGLNPHAGEGGIIGNEEVEKLIPALKEAKKHIMVQGPFSPDAFFAKRRYKDFDLTFGLYHDQVLIPFKYIAEGKGVNFTAGLPVVRTSPDHGVAYDIAWKALADESGIVSAARYARLIVKNRRRDAVSNQ